MQVSAFDIDVIETCAHRVPLDGECESCVRTGRHTLPGTFRDSDTDRIVHFGGPDQYVKCPHGALVPLFGKVTRKQTFCTDCERQREAGRTQDDEIKVLTRKLGRPRKVLKKHRAAYDAAVAAWRRGEVSDFGIDADGVWATDDRQEMAA